MPRARNIKPSFFRNPDLAELEPIERLLFIGLWTMADREGRLEDRPRYIKFELLPSDQFDIDVALNALQNRGFILRYEHGDGRFIQVVNFVKHQNPHVKEAPSTIPAPDKHGADTMQAGLNPDSPLLNPESGLLNEDAGEAPAEKQADEPKAKTPRKQPETFVPETFPLEDRHYEYAAKKGLTRAEAERETEKFLLWHGAKQTRYGDWYKTWQNWILRAGENKSNLTPFQKPADPTDDPTLTDAQRYAIAKLERMRTRDWMNSAEALRYNGSNGDAHYAEDLIVYGKVAKGEPVPARGVA